MDLVFRHSRVRGYDPLLLGVVCRLRFPSYNSRCYSELFIIMSRPIMPSSRSTMSSYAPQCRVLTICEIEAKTRTF
jgi:hypothetical protein